ncbi:hypothetical protein Tco_0454929 [Tanacetum coccineum]
MEKKSDVARQNRLTEVDGEVSKHTAGFKTILQHKFQMGDGMDEACEGKTREYVTASSKRVADVVEAAIVEKHGPDTIDLHPMTLIYRKRLLGGRRKEN